MVEGGNRIYAPVSPDDVAEVLGVNSFDTRTLCRSDEVNPDSLIRPLYTENPALGPESFPTMIPDGPQHIGGLNWNYMPMRWGYFVPYVGNPADINLIVDETWKRNPPTGISYDCLTHFDGYQHNAKPRLPLSVQALSGQTIKFTMFPGQKQTVLSADGKANPGGVVALYEVLGSVRIGCTMYNTQGGVIGSWISPAPIGQTALQEQILIDTQITAVSNTTYRVVPWATDGNIVNGQIVQNSHFYSLRFSEENNGDVQIHVPSVSIAISKVVVTKTSSTLKFNVTVLNEYQAAQSVYNFRLYAQFTKFTGEVVEKEVELSGNTAVNVPAASSGGSSSVTIELSCTDTDIFSNYNNLRSMIVIASCNTPSGFQTLQSPELAGYQTNA